MAARLGTILCVIAAAFLAALPRLGALKAEKPPVLPAPTSIETAAADIDRILEQCWRDKGVEPAADANQAALARRLALVLEGRIPAYEELRWIESQPPGEATSRYADRLIADRRHADYFAERLARGLAPSMPAEAFFAYRRNRFVSWLGDQLHGDRPYDELVTELITATGLWTDRPAVNFLSSHDQDPVKLATRTTRVFLGLRLDCAQCHDHPFRDWKQTDFQGLAAFYGQVQLGFVGIRDGKGEYRLDEMGRPVGEVVEPVVPFSKELDPGEGWRRERLAHWVTHPDNPYFARAIVHRYWRLIFGKGLIEPIDDLEQEAIAPAAVERLADDFREHGYNLRRLTRILVRTRAFSRASALLGPVAPAQEAVFAAYPLNRLRPEQLAASLAQCSSLQTLDARDHWLFRLIDFSRQRDFIDAFGDRPDDELESRSGNLPQKLLLMNGKPTVEELRPGLLSATSRIAALAPGDSACVRLAYQVALSRLPDEAEEAHFSQSLAGTKGEERARRVEDLLWALVNSTEFSWSP